MDLGIGIFHDYDYGATGVARAGREFKDFTLQKINTA